MSEYFNIKIFFSLLGILTIIIAYSYYIYGILKEKIKPHIFSWIFWGILTFTGFLIQQSDNAGPGARVTLFTALVCFFIVFLSIKGGINYIKRSDIIALFGAFFTFFIWIYSENLYVSLFFLLLTDFLSAFPTIRKAYFSPSEESPFTFFLAGLKSFFSLFALDTFSIATSLYPLYLVSMGWLVSIFILIRQYQLKKD